MWPIAKNWQRQAMRSRIRWLSWQYNPRCARKGDIQTSGEGIELGLVEGLSAQGWQPGHWGGMERLDGLEGRLR